MKKADLEWFSVREVEWCIAKNSAGLPCLEKANEGAGGSIWCFFFLVCCLFSDGVVGGWVGEWVRDLRCVWWLEFA